MSRNNIGWGAVYLANNIVDGEVNTYADLANLTDLFEGDVYLVKQTTGILGFRKLSGLYRWSGSEWTSLQVQMQGSLVYFNSTGTPLTSITTEDAIKEVNNRIGYWDN
jgi:hypothetical protein